jgi:hypothetical protein
MEERRRFLTCPICYIEFDTHTHIPLSLLCGHTACKECLIKNPCFTCPMDGFRESRTLTEIPILQLIYDMIDDYSSSLKTPHLAICPFHKRSLDLFCKECQITFCVKCLCRHKTHEYLDIDQSDPVVKEVKDKFGTFFMQNKANYYQADQYLQDISRAKAELQKRQKQFKSSLRCKYAKIHEKIDKKLVEDLNFIDEKVKPIFSYLSDMQERHEDILEEHKYFDEQANSLKKELDSLPNNLSILNHFKRFNLTKSPIKPSDFDPKRTELDLKLTVEDFEVESAFHSLEEQRYYTQKDAM